MSQPDPASSALEQQIERWRSYLNRRQAVHTVDVAELEDHLREQVAALTEAGLRTEEAFLVAVKRMGDLDSLSREFAREHSERLWKQLVMAPEREHSDRGSIRDTMMAFAFAVAAAVAIKLPTLFGIRFGEGASDQDAAFYARNLGLFVLPLLAAYFAWKRQLGRRSMIWLALAFVAAAAFANVYPIAPTGDMLLLTVLHLPIVLWLLVGMAYAGNRWNAVAGRMDFIRFTGELFLYYVLIALGGAVLTGFVLLIFQTIGIDAEYFVQSWLLPCGAAGAVLIASWLVEAKQSVIENMAPVLTRIFTPLFVILLLVFLGALLVTGSGIDIERNLLIAFDLLLVVVLGLLLYAISARDPQTPPVLFDFLQLALVVSALLANGLALSAIGGRIFEMGFTPNRVAALGENLILLANLGWSAVLYIKFLRGRGSFAALEQWQTSYLPVYAAWATLVVFVFPPLFGYL